MARKPRRTRAQIRQQRVVVPDAGVYGVDAKDAGAGCWVGRYLCYAASPGQARARIVAAGFHMRQTWAIWSPGNVPPEGLPPDLRAGDNNWYRSRMEDDGWTAWERLPADYRHPPQGLAARDVSVR